MLCRLRTEMRTTGRQYSGEAFAPAGSQGQGALSCEGPGTSLTQGSGKAQRPLLQRTLTKSATAVTPMV